MRLLIAERRGGGQPRLRGGRRHLAAGHAVDLVVEHQAGELEIAPAGVDQMIAADRQTIAVAGDDDDMQIGTRQRQAGRIGERPAVRDMEGVGVDIGRQPPGAADAGDDRELVLVDAEIVDRPQQRAQRDAMAATGAEEVRHHLRAEIIADVEVGGGVDEHHASLASAAAQVAISAGVIASPLNRCRPSTGMIAEHALDLEPELAGVHLGDQHGARAGRGLAQRFFGERPQRDRPEQADAQPLRAAHLDGAARGAGADADGDNDHVGVVAVQRFPGVDQVAVAVELGEQAATDCG